MLPPDYLTHCADDITALYERFEDSVINDMARRIGKMSVSESSVLQTEILEQAGLLREDVIKRIAALTGESDVELYNLFEDVGAMSITLDDQVYTKAGLSPIPFTQSKAMMDYLIAGLIKTGGSIKNLTMTTAISSQVNFINALNLAYMQISSGAMSYTEAIKRAVSGLASQGVNVIYFDSGWQDKIDVAVRRAAITGVNQTTAQLQLIRADELGCELVETTAHWSARPSHQVWQGKVFSRKGNNKSYPDFVQSTGYGAGAGLCGWNCRHSFFPYFEGISTPAYSKGQYNDRIITYNGKDMTLYDASQKQRAMERSIRQTKRELSATNTTMTATSDPMLEKTLKEQFTTLSTKLKTQEAKYRSFSDTVGLPFDKPRVQVYGFGRSVSSKAVWANRKA